MPEGTKVHNLYKELLGKGYSKESAVRIAQARTGLSLMTGKKPKGRRERGNVSK